MYPSDPNDPAVLNMAGVKALADVTILNEGLGGDRANVPDVYRTLGRVL